MAGIPEWRAKWLHHIPASQVATPNDGDRDVMEDARADCSAVRGVCCSARGAGNRSNAFNPRPKTVPWRRGAGASHQQRADPRAYRQPSSLLHRCVSSLGESSVIYVIHAGKRGDSRTLPYEICAHIQPVRGHATTRRHIARTEHTMDLRRQSVRGTGVRAIGLAFLLREAMRQNSMPSQSGA